MNAREDLAQANGWMLEWGKLSFSNKNNNDDQQRTGQSSLWPMVFSCSEPLLQRPPATPCDAR